MRGKGHEAAAGQRTNLDAFGSKKIVRVGWASLRFIQ
jgi:hypothetical protein